jgi:hypothetical protein
MHADSAPHVKPLRGASTARPWPFVEKPTVHTNRSTGSDAVRYTSVDTRNIGVYSATR